MTGTSFGFVGLGAGSPLTIEPGLAACHFSMPSRPPSSAGAKPLALDGVDVDDDGAVGLERLPRAPQRRSATSWPSITPM